jgi:hypothetical protein
MREVRPYAKHLPKLPRAAASAGSCNQTKLLRRGWLASHALIPKCTTMPESPPTPLPRTAAQPRCRAQLPPLPRAPLLPRRCTPPAPAAALRRCRAAARRPRPRPLPRTAAAAAARCRRRRSCAIFVLEFRPGRWLRFPKRASVGTAKTKPLAKGSHPKEHFGMLSASFVMHLVHRPLLQSASIKKVKSNF